jgi:OmpA-OmpF porin, OOP family
MFKKAILAVAVATCGFGVTTSAFAQQAYAGVSGGVSNWSVDCEGAAKCDKSNPSFKVFGGYNINQSIAIEAAYATLGKTTISGATTGGVLDAEFKAQAFDVAGVFKLPINTEFSAFAKLGVSFVNSEVDAALVSGNITQRGSVSDRSTQLLAGLGLTYNISKDIALRGEWEARKFQLEDEKSSINSFTVGVQFNF